MPPDPKAQPAGALGRRRGWKPAIGSGRPLPGVLHWLLAPPRAGLFLATAGGFRVQSGDATTPPPGPKEGLGRTSNGAPPDDGGGFFYVGARPKISATEAA